VAVKSRDSWNDIFMARVLMGMKTQIPRLLIPQIQTTRMKVITLWRISLMVRMRLVWDQQFRWGVLQL
jgi:hypothetical protein